MDLDLAETETRLAPRVRTMQIIAAAMVAGVLTMGAIFAFLAAQRGPEPGDAAEEAEVLLDGEANAADPVFSYVALGIAGLALAAYKPLGSLATRFAPPPETSGEPEPRGDDLAAAAGRFQARLIVRLAILEGAALICLIAVLIENWPYVWIGVGVLIAAMLAEFPTAGGLRRYVESRRQLAAFASEDRR